MRITLQLLAVIFLTFLTAIPVGVWLTSIGIQEKLLLYLVIFGFFALWLFVVLRFTGFGQWQNRFLGKKRK